MRKIVTLIMCVWMLASCQESREEAMRRLVNEWNGKEIKFPSRSVFTIQGKDTVDFEFVDADYKVVTYIDSVGCTSCKLQLPAERINAERMKLVLIKQRIKVL